MDRWNTSATVNGEKIPSGGDFRTVVTEKAQALGYNGYFRVFVNDREVGDTTPPDTIRAGDVIQIKPYDKAGS